MAVPIFLPPDPAIRAPGYLVRPGAHPFENETRILQRERHGGPLATKLVVLAAVALAIGGAIGGFSSSLRGLMGNPAPCIAAWRPKGLLAVQDGPG